MTEIQQTKRNQKDECLCGDYREDHHGDTGACKLGSLCTPFGCRKFRLAFRAGERDAMSRVRASLPQPPAGSTGEAWATDEAWEKAMRSAHSQFSKHFCIGDLLTPGPEHPENCPYVLALCECEMCRSNRPSTPAQSGLERRWMKLWVAMTEIRDLEGGEDILTDEEAIKEALRIANEALDEDAHTPSQPAPVDENYLVWSHEHGAWWRPDRCGYTVQEKLAGRYSKDEALSICKYSRDGWPSPSKTAPTEIPVRESDIITLTSSNRPQATEGEK